MKKTLSLLIALFTISLSASELTQRTSKKELLFSDLCYTSLEHAKEILKNRKPTWPGMTQYRGERLEGVSPISMVDEVIVATFLQEGDFEKAYAQIDSELDLNFDQYDYQTYAGKDIGRTIKIAPCGM